MDEWTLLAAAGVSAVAAGAGFALWRGRGATTLPGAARPPPDTGPAPSRRMRRGLGPTRPRLARRRGAVRGGGAVGVGSRPLDVVLGELEEVLLGADVGVSTSAALLEPVRSRLGGEASPEAIRQALEEGVRAIVAGPPPPEPATQPWVILVTGVNGVGKTTTIGKLAALHGAAGRRVLLVAADTFRAAAIDQLAVWAERAGADPARPEPG